MSQVETISELDELLAGLEHEHHPDCDLLREHLQAARSYALGAMPAEYKLNLRLAENIANCVQHEETRDKIKDLEEIQLAVGI